jgi:hypothetical protein
MNKPLFAAVAATAISIAAFVHLKWDDWFILPELREPVLGMLKDPASAQFRGETRNQNILCGEVNAKNSMGGYVGFKRFFVAGSDYGIDGTALSGSNSSTKSTEEIISDLELQTNLMRTLGRKPTDEEILSAKFSRLWKKWCERS